MRNAKLLWIVLFLSLPVMLLAYDLERKETKTFPATNLKGVSISNVNGDINIQGQEVDEVKVVAFKYLKTGNEKEAERLIKDFTIKYEIEDGILKIKAEPPKTFGFWLFEWLFGGVKESSVHFDIILPMELALSTSTVNGSVEIRNFLGRLEASTVNGKIRAYGIGNDADISTVNGTTRIIIDNARGDQLDVSTVNGKIEIMIDESIGFTFDCSTINGGIHSDFPLEKGEKKKTGFYRHRDGHMRIHASAVNGSIRLSRL